LIWDDRTCIPCCHPCRNHINIPHRARILSGNSIVAFVVIVEAKAAGRKLAGRASHFDWLKFAIIEDSGLEVVTWVTAVKIQELAGLVVIVVIDWLGFVNTIVYLLIEYS